MTFTSRETNAAVGLRESASYRDPSHPGGKPPPVRRTVVVYPRGTRFDTTVPAQCNASDEELQASGAAACPARSLIGHGSATFVTGFPGPFATVDIDLDVLNKNGQVIFLAKPHGGSTVVSVARSKLRGRTATTDVPAIPGGPPDGQTSLKRIGFHTKVVTRMRRGRRVSYITTPRTCPRSGYWTSTDTFVYGDGVTQTLHARANCKHRRRHRKRRDR